MSYRNNYLDLDPTYKDPLGRPLMRMTFDYQDNERKMANWMADRCDEIAKAMGAKTTQVNRLIGPWSWCPIRPRTTPAARSWAAIPRPACSTAICSPGTSRTCS